MRISILSSCKGLADIRNVSGLSTDRSFRRHLLRAFPVFLVVTLLTLLLEYAGWLRGFETAALDTWLRLIKPITPQFVRVVSINEDDYRDIFGHKSPLDPQTLKTLIQAIAQGDPLVIGVDIDTSAAEWRNTAADFVTPAGGRTDIVWEQEAIGEAEQLTPLKILGGAEITPVPLSGIAGLFQDWDGVIRRYQRHFQTTRVKEGQAKLIDSFPWAVVKAFHQKSSQESRLPNKLRKAIEAEARGGRKIEDERLLNFSGNRYDFQPYAASFVLSAHEAAWWKEKSPFRGKIVLLGGSFRAGRDVYTTPLGMTTGIQLMAQAVESELQGRGIYHSNKFLMILFDFVAWIALVAVYYFCRLSVALWTSIVAIPLLSLTGSLFAFSSLAYWADFAPVVLGVLIHQLYDHAQEYRRLLKESQS